MALTQFELLLEHITEMAYGLGDFAPITLDQFEQMIITFDKSNKGTAPISFTSVTKPKLKSVKAGFLPYAGLYKVGQTNGLIGFDYEANVNAQRGREGQPTDFKKQQMSTIAEWVSDSIGITTTGLKVLIYRALKSAPSFWVTEDSSGVYAQITDDVAKQYLAPSAPQSNQGIEKKINYRTYGFDKIVAVSFQTKEYMISNVDAKRKEIFDVVAGQLRS
jgi:hypothetical protein